MEEERAALVFLGNFWGKGLLLVVKREHAFQQAPSCFRPLCRLLFCPGLSPQPSCVPWREEPGEGYSQARDHQLAVPLAQRPREVGYGRGNDNGSQPQIDFFKALFSFISRFYWRKRRAAKYILPSALVMCHL